MSSNKTTKNNPFSSNIVETYYDRHTTEEPPMMPKRSHQRKYPPKPKTLEELVADYKEKIREYAYDDAQVVSVPRGFREDPEDTTPVVLTCRLLDNLTLPSRSEGNRFINPVVFTANQREPWRPIAKNEVEQFPCRFQYNLRFKPFSDLGYSGRPNAFRIPFITLVDQEIFNDENITVSHLCHNPVCYRLTHTVLEPLDVNIQRSSCGGGLLCAHELKCIIPGPRYNDMLFV